MLSLPGFFGPSFILATIGVACFLFLCPSSILNRIFCCKPFAVPSENVDETEYEELSPEQKLELDKLRSRAIHGRLSRFTLVLNIENMLKQSPASVPESSSFLCDDAEGKEDGKRNRIDDDVERGADAMDNSVQMAPACANANADEEYTHVVIPRAGHAIFDRDVIGLQDSCPDKEKNMIRCLSRRLLFLTSKVGVPNNNVEMEQTEGEMEQRGGSTKCREDEPCPIEPVDDILPETRAVPVFCAVCLMQYELSDRVCWSPNSQCTHVFHEDCILQWLLTLGRKRSNLIRFSVNPTEESLLDYDLSCPCCRQSFISSNLIVKTDDNV